MGYMYIDGMRLSSLIFQSISWHKYLKLSLLQTFCSLKAPLLALNLPKNCVMFSSFNIHKPDMHQNRNCTKYKSSEECSS